MIIFAIFIWALFNAHYFVAAAILLHWAMK